MITAIELIAIELIAERRISEAIAAGNRRKATEKISVGGGR